MSKDFTEKLSRLDAIENAILTAQLAAARAELLGIVSELRIMLQIVQDEKAKLHIGEARRILESRIDETNFDPALSQELDRVLATEEELGK